MVFLLLLLGLLFWIGYVVGKQKNVTYHPVQQNATQLQVIYDLAATLLHNSSKRDKETLIVLYAIQYVTNYSMTLEYALQIARAYVESLENSPSKNAELSRTSLQTKEMGATGQTSTAQSPQHYATLTQERPQREPIDKTSQLLYFGAFLLVTSIGLFVGFAEVDGILKVFLLSIVALILYGSGDYLFSSTKSLQRVGTTFIAVSLLSLPFIGISSHIYVLDRMYPELVWLITSVLSFSAYLFSLHRYKQTLTGYLVIGSAVSSLLSIIGVLSLPTHVFYWGLIAIGLLLKLISARHNSDVLITKPSEHFAMVLVPLALFTSLISITDADIVNGRFILENTGQFAVSLALATLYAYTGSVTEKDEQTKELYAQTVHPLAVLAVAVGVYSVDQSLFQTGLMLQLISIFYIARNALMNSNVHASYEPTALTVVLFGILFTVTNPVYTSLGVVIAICLSASLAARMRRYGYGFLTAALFMILTIIVGQYLLSDRLSLLEQITFTSGAVIIILAASLLLRLRNSLAGASYATEVDVVATVSIGILLLSTLATLQEDFYALFGAVWFSLLLLYWLAVRRISDKTIKTHDEWLVAAYTVLYVAQIGILFNQTEKALSYDLSASLAVLVASILGALLTRAAWTRWASTIQWLLLPIVLIYTSTLGVSFSLPSITLLYGCAAFFLMGSRLIALGRVQEAFSKKSLVSLMGGESTAYMFGFLSCIAIVGFFAVFDSYNSMWQAIILTVVTMVLVWYLSYVERMKNAFAIVPIAAQIIIGRLLWPTASIFNDYSLLEARTLLPAASTVVALLVYSYFYSLYIAREKARSVELDLSLAMFYISPFMVLMFAHQTWSMAVGLIIAGIATIHYFAQASLSKKEFSGAVILAGVQWLLANQGVTNIIFHIHLVALLLALYAIIRELKGQSITSQSYSTTATFTLTIPLVLAALAHEGIYSLLLLIEMSGLFIIGLSVNRKLVYRTGLYTAVGALAYQLRSYGYAVVALIAIVVIGFAIHSALKQGRNDN